MSLQRTRFENHDRVAVTAGFVNHSATPVANVSLTLEVDGQSIQSLPVERRAARLGERHVRPVHRRVAQHARDGEAARRRDQRATTCSTSSCRRRSRCASSSSTAPAPDSEALYLLRALAIGEAPRVELTAARADARSPTPMRAPPQVVVLNDVQVSDDLADRLRASSTRAAAC